MMMEQSVDLEDLLGIDQLTSVVAIGANPVDGPPPFRPLLDRGLCHVVGFEPQLDALTSLERSKSEAETYLPYVIGDGSEQTFHRCAASGMSGCLKANASTSAVFPLFAEFGRIIESERVQTRTLDSISEIERLDYLQIDVQGSELSILQAGRVKLSQAVAIQTEVSFVPLYENQPAFGALDLELRGQGFIPHAMVDRRNWIIAPMVLNNNPRQPLNQLLEADFVYVKDFRKPEEFRVEQWRHLALIAHYCYRSYDLALYCIRQLARRDAIDHSCEEKYVEIVRDCMTNPVLKSRQGN